MKIDRRLSWSIIPLGVVAGSLLFGISGSSAGPVAPTFGSIPPDAAMPGHDVDLSKVPDFISVIGGPDGNTIIGYVRKSDVFATSKMPANPAEAVLQNAAPPTSIPLFDSNGHEIGSWKG